MAKKSQKNKWYDKNIDQDIADAIVRLEVVLPNRVGSIKRDFRPDIEIDYDDLEVQLEETPSLFLFWSLVLSEQKAEVAKLNRMIKVRRSNLATKLLGSDDGNKSIAKWKIDEFTETDDKLIELESKLILASKTESKLYAIVESARMKSEHIRSLAGFKRQELRDVPQ